MPCCSWRVYIEYGYCCRLGQVILHHLFHWIQFRLPEPFVGILICSGCYIDVHSCCLGSQCVWRQNQLLYFDRNVSRYSYHCKNIPKSQNDLKKSYNLQWMTNSVCWLDLWALKVISLQYITCWYRNAVNVSSIHLNSLTYKDRSTLVLTDVNDLLGKCKMIISYGLSFQGWV